MNVDNRSFWSFLKTKNVTVRVRPVHEEPCAVFRVLNLIDLGGGRQTAVLQGYLPEENTRHVSKKASLAMPRKIGNLDIVYTTRKITPVSHIYKVIAQVLDRCCMDRIVPEVLAPGDFLVFIKRPRKGGMKIEALRANPIGLTGVAHAV